MIRPHWTVPFVGIPYADKGRARHGCDCWGLARLVYAEVRGIELPSYDELYITAADRAEIAAIVAREQHSTLWEAVDRAEPFDILWFRRGRLDAHAGIFAERGVMLHMVEEDCAKIERFDRLPWSGRLTGIYRWRGGQ